MVPYQLRNPIEHNISPEYKELSGLNCLLIHPVGQLLLMNNKTTELKINESEMVTVGGFFPTVAKETAFGAEQ